MPDGLSRIYGYGHLHFITFSCHQRAKLLGSEAARDRFAQILGEVRDRYGFALVGYVVMPEHAHLAIAEPPGATPSTVIQVLKQRSSRGIRGLCGASAEQLGQFWERRFYDFNIRTWKKLNEKLRYMHMNPVKRGWLTSRSCGLGAAICFTRREAWERYGSTWRRGSSEKVLQAR